MSSNPRPLKCVAGLGQVEDHTGAILFIDSVQIGRCILQLHVYLIS